MPPEIYFCKGSAPDCPREEDVDGVKGRVRCEGESYKCCKQGGQRQGEGIVEGCSALLALKSFDIQLENLRGMKVRELFGEQK